MEIKQCFKCKKVKSITEFRQYKNGRNKGHHFSYCKKCHRIAIREWRNNNKEQCRRHDRKWKSAHLDYMNEYRKKNKDNIKKCRAIYIEKNRDKVVESQRNWRYRNPLSVKASYHKRRFLTRDLTIQVIQRVYEDNIKRYGTLTCYLCLTPTPFGKDHLEHKIPLSRDGTNVRGNLGVACQKCNLSKNNKTVEEFSKREVAIVS